MERFPAPRTAPDLPLSLLGLAAWIRLSGAPKAQAPGSPIVDTQHIGIRTSRPSSVRTRWQLVGGGVISHGSLVIWGVLFGSLNLRKPDFAAQTGNTLA
ncbi:shwachman-Bodian-diamond protein-like protein [Rhodovulum sulfidophilum]|uniref:Shwachman-Bodian-diamond protein-like protein n=1 Tax=Rhodovulum sulfidophilum TaxID=35806 RepID=A0A0D6AWV6_RHOSU|nr:shwachman-Bodian-diamond protein-like protein [Rhodovulum sulfidophilum]